MAFFCLCQSLLLGTFAAILGAHRSEILEKQEEHASRMVGSATGGDRTGDEAYQTPYERS